MKESMNYIQDVVNNRKKLVKTLNNIGISASLNASLSSVVNKCNLLSSQNIKAFSFVSKKSSIVIHMKGNGVVKVYNEYESQTVELNEDTGVNVILENLSASDRYYFIDEVDGLIELDLHDNEITQFNVNKDNHLNKLVIYNNNITQLDCSLLKKLQFLHMFNNPICDNDLYKDNLIVTIESLPDRSDMSMGSLVFYPWYGLETLIEQDEQGEYHKYPHIPSSTKNFNNPSNSYYKYLYDDSGKYRFNEGRLYRLVNNNSGYTLGEYYEYKGSQLLNRVDINRHTNIRKEILEPILLPKFWVVGSAILYDETASKRCPWDFRQLHTADIWETAEKGFGVTLGAIDSFTLLTPDIDCFNIRSFTPKSGYDCPKLTFEQLTNGIFKSPRPISTHGDGCYSVVLGHGVDPKDIELGLNNETGVCDNLSSKTPSRFGNSPLCDCVLEATTSFITQLSNMCKADSVDVISTSQSTSDSTVSGVLSKINNYKNERNNINKFASTKILTNSSANSGAGRPYLHNFQHIDEVSYYASDAYWGNDDEYHFMGYYTPSLSRDNTVSFFSVSSQGTTNTPLVTDDYIAAYGHNIVSYKITKDDNSVGLSQYHAFGTSYSSPLLASQFILLMNIYKKLPNTDVTSFGKNSEFMRFVKSHWLDRLSQNMDFAQGLGMLNPMAEPTNGVTLLKNEQSLPNSVVCSLGEYVDLKCNDEGKQTFTPEYQFDKIAITRNGHLYPLHSGKIDSLPLYSNTSRDSSRLVEDVGGIETTYYDKNYFKRELTIDTQEIVVTPELNSLTHSEEKLDESIDVFKLDSNNEDFTVSLCVDLNKSFTEFGNSAPVDSILFIPVCYYKNKKDELSELSFIGAIKKSDNKLDFSNCDLRLMNSDTTQGGYVISKFDLLYITTEDKADSKGEIAKNSVTIGNNFGNVVLTFVRKGPELLYYFNGTYRGTMSFYDDYIKEFFIDKEFLCGDSADCMYTYNKVFTDDEVAKNTVSILNNHSF